MTEAERNEHLTIPSEGNSVGISRPTQRPFVPRAMLIAAFRGAPAIDGKRFKADIDALFAPDRN